MVLDLVRGRVSRVARWFRMRFLQLWMREVMKGIPMIRVDNCCFWILTLIRLLIPIDACIWVSVTFAPSAGENALSAAQLYLLLVAYIATRGCGTFCLITCRFMTPRLVGAIMQVLWLPNGFPLVIIVYFIED